MRNKYDSLKLKSGEEIHSLEISLQERIEEASQIEAHENEVVPKLQRRITELETMLVVAEEDAEYQKKLTQELGMKIYFNK